MSTSTSGRVKVELGSEEDRMFYIAERTGPDTFRFGRIPLQQGEVLILDGGANARGGAHRTYQPECSPQENRTGLRRSQEQGIYFETLGGRFEEKTRINYRWSVKVGIHEPEEVALEDQVGQGNQPKRPREITFGVDVRVQQRGAQATYWTNTSLTVPNKAPQRLYIQRELTKVFEGVEQIAKRIGARVERKLRRTYLTRTVVDCVGAILKRRDQVNYAEYKKWRKNRPQHIQELREHEQKVKERAQRRQRALRRAEQELTARRRKTWGIRAAAAALVSLCALGLSPTPPIREQKDHYSATAPQHYTPQTQQPQKTPQRQLPTQKQTTIPTRSSPPRSSTPTQRRVIRQQPQRQWVTYREPVQGIPKSSVYQMIQAIGQGQAYQPPDTPIIFRRKN